MKRDVPTPFLLRLLEATQLGAFLSRLRPAQQAVRPLPLRRRSRLVYRHRKKILD